MLRCDFVAATINRAFAHIEVVLASRAVWRW
jgi:hypothetical protein